VILGIDEELRGPVPGADIPAPDPDGLVELDLPEGIYRVRIAAPPAYAPEVTAPQPATAVVLAGEVADLGGLYLVPPGLPAAAQLLCIIDAECGRGTCAQGSCRNYSPPLRAPAGLPLCDPVDGKCTTAGTTCLALDGETGSCQDAIPGNAICVPCGLECTPDGVGILRGTCP
jgi:hypothetical protein